MTVTILHTNDFHGRLSDSQAQTIRSLQQQNPGAILVDCGDAVSAGNIGVRPGGEPILELMSDLGYRCMTLGNREFHVADALLRAKIGKAAFPVLCANMRRRDDSGETMPVSAHVVVETDGVRVGIFGLTVPMVTPRMAARVVSAFLFDDPIAAAKLQISELRDKTDLIVALTHIGLHEDDKLARACPELACIIGGHTHAVLDEPRREFGVPIVQAGSHAHFIGRVTIEIGTGRPQVNGALYPLADLHSRRARIEDPQRSSAVQP